MSILTSEQIKPRVFVIDDDPAMRDSLSWLIQSVGREVTTFSNAQAFLDYYPKEAPGCLILDVRMPGISGIDLLQKLPTQGIFLPVILLTGFADVAMSVRALKQGAFEFMEKPFNQQMLLDRIEEAIELDAKQRNERISARQFIERDAILTPKEKEVLVQVVQGLSSREIGTMFDVSSKTVEAHRSKIMKKMGAESIPHLVRMCLLRKVVPHDSRFEIDVFDVPEGD